MTAEPRTSATVVVPPMADPTLTLRWPGPAPRLIDCGRQFFARVLTGAQRSDDAGQPPAVLAAKSALADPSGPLSRLRAGALLVPAMTGDDTSAVEITLDDLELRHGSTQDSAAVRAAARGPAPYDPELDAAVAAVGPRDDVWLVLDRDQQLPAALALAGRLPGPLRVTGRYARTHWPVLSRLPELARARFEEPPGPLGWRVAGLPNGPDTHGPNWRERAADPVPRGPWAGRVGLRPAVESPGELVARRCVVAVLGLCAADHGTYVGRGGTALPARKVNAALGGLRAAGVTVLAELWLGAPGVGADRVRETVAVLTAPDGPVDRVVGLRPFDWPVHWTGPTWGTTRVGWPEPDADAPDLARGRAFRAPGTLDADGVQALVSELGPPLAASGSLIPARVAAAYVAGEPADADPPLRGIALAPDTVLVDGHAVDLRRGRVVRLDRRVTDRLRVGHRPVPDTDALPGVTPTTRAVVLDALVTSGLLVRR